MGKKFIKGGGAEEYEGISVEYIRGRTPILTIYEDGTKREEIKLSQYDTLEALHALMADKGFHKKVVGAAGNAMTVEGKSIGAAIKGVERLEKRQSLGTQGEVIGNAEDLLDSDPVNAFGYITGAAIGGFLIYTIIKSRKKDELNHTL